MAHQQQAEFVDIVKRHLPGYFSGCRVIEMGSLDINGSARQHFDAASYVGVDLGPGPGVDVIKPAQLVDEPTGAYDCACSVNCFEHNPYWLETFINMLRLVRVGGMVFFTNATTGCREHGTARSAPESSPFTRALGWPYYRNLTQRDFTERLDLQRWCSDWRFFVSHESYDLCFVALRGGPQLPKLPARLEDEMLERFSPWRSARSVKRYLKVKLFGNLFSSPLSCYFTARR